MKTHEVFQDVQEFLKKKQANTFMGHSLITGLECKEGFYVKYTHVQIPRERKYLACRLRYHNLPRSLSAIVCSRVSGQR